MYSHVLEHDQLEYRVDYLALIDVLETSALALES